MEMYKLPRKVRPITSHIPGKLHLRTCTCTCTSHIQFRHYTEHIECPIGKEELYIWYTGIVQWESVCESVDARRAEDSVTNQQVDTCRFYFLPRTHSLSWWHGSNRLHLWQSQHHANWYLFSSFLHSLFIIILITTLSLF